ncbi:competence/damage-inducible protein cinA [Thermanaeromonas toyohensis ToBE]|uniref:Putative competence-damage inducible protein n=1 Tax=Thermanaeromonas toyohensis ToBE TaxID=698762 RepID=A0A1W1VL37_9FIRM|nr:competence/damage-inducible protein A [Thermanaeromonas toyohensis]SMB93771.1 competence/damage-inducible protein cinA [Thermanaeromonas toyohensis ToBE]
MQAEAIFTGTELLLGQIINTNAAFLSQELAKAGISIFRQVVVGDNLERIKEAIQEAGKRADLIIVCGGLGPTEDDLTREALAGALGLPLEENPSAREHIIRFFSLRDRPMPPQNLKQALFPRGAIPLDNPLGTAPGIFLEHNGKLYACLPGPPSEFRVMLTEKLLPLLQQYSTSKEIIFSRVLKITGLGESAVEEKIQDLLKGTNPTLATLASPGEIHLRITAKAKDTEAALDLIKPLEKEIRQRLKEHIFGSDGDTLEGVVGNLLTLKGLTLAVAESCTGGLLAHRLTNIPGSSAYFHQGIVAYNNKVKLQLLGVTTEILASRGAVSEEVALAMARGVRGLAGTDIGIGITGIAGPGGGTPAKPVGLVYLAIDYQGTTQVRRELFQGLREEIKWRATQSALDMLWRLLKG